MATLVMLLDKIIAEAHDDCYGPQEPEHINDPLGYPYVIFYLSKKGTISYKIVFKKKIL